MGIKRLKRGITMLVAWGADRGKKVAEEAVSTVREEEIAGGSGNQEVVGVQTSDLRQCMLYVYRLRALLYLAGQETRNNLVEELSGSAGQFLGLSKGASFPKAPKKLDEWLTRLLEAHEAQLARLVEQDSTLFKSLDVLLEALGMHTPVHKTISRYLCVAMANEPTRRLLDECVLNPMVSDHLEVMAVLTEQELSAVEEAIHQLEESGLVLLRGGGFYSVLDEEGVVLSKHIRRLLSRDIRDREGFVRHLSPRIDFDDSITLNDYAHMQNEIELAQHILMDGAAKGDARHLLLVGEPGTGKTSCAFAMAKALGKQLVTVAVEDSDGDHLSDPFRLSDYRLKQAFFRMNQDKTLILFDESESIFGSPVIHMGIGGGGYTSKARITALMDGAGVSTIWITNTTDDWDPAYLRRFSLILRISIPPLEVRKEQVRKICAQLQVSDGFIAQLAERRLPVALVRQAAETVLADRVEEGMRTILDGYLSAVGEPPLRQTCESGLPPFNMRYLNLSEDVEQLFKALKETQSLRLLFEGPPGAGKTELAYQVAKHAGKDLLEVRASDLLSKYVGDTEKRIAAWFARSAAEEAVLLIDEADSFIRSRDVAHHAWEVSQVNELLVQIEAYPGILILGTNFREALDEALIRRVDFKVAFHPLDNSQRIELFHHIISYNGGEDVSLPEEVIRTLAGMDRLVVGDFRPPVRRLMVMRESITPASLLRELCEEYRIRYPSRTIGFVGD